MATTDPTPTPLQAQDPLPKDFSWSVRIENAVQRLETHANLVTSEFGAITANVETGAVKYGMAIAGLIVGFVLGRVL